MVPVCCSETHVAVVLVQESKLMCMKCLGCVSAFWMWGNPSADLHDIQCGGKLWNPDNLEILGFLKRWHSQYKITSPLYHLFQVKIRRANMHLLESSHPLGRDVWPWSLRPDTQEWRNICGSDSVCCGQVCLHIKLPFLFRDIMFNC